MKKKQSPSLEKFFLPIMPEVPLSSEDKGKADWFSKKNLCFWGVYRENPEMFHRTTVCICDKEDFPTEGGTRQKTNLRWPRQPLDQAFLQFHRQNSHLEGPAVIAPEELGKRLPGLNLSLSTVEVEGRLLLCLQASNEESECLVLLSDAFPLFAPIVAVTLHEGETVHPRFSWVPESKSAPEERLARLIHWCLLAGDGQF